MQTSVGGQVRYKGQHEPWSPAYPALFHDHIGELYYYMKKVPLQTMYTHNIVIKAIEKARG